jgi:hypothetical protein
MVIQKLNGSIEIICDWCAARLSDYVADLPKDFITAYRVAEANGIKSESTGERCSYCV